MLDSICHSLFVKITTDDASKLTKRDHCAESLKHIAARPHSPPPQGKFMGALFEIPVQSEVLSHDELQEICGCTRRSDQIDWLITNGWTFLRNRAGDPIVGRMYARLKLAGINPAGFGVSNTWTPDFSKVR